MAKKGKRSLFLLQCSVCKNRNYTGSKNTIKVKDKITLSKFCKNCRKHTEHKEIKL